jgi:capsular exopolysaccharide synthesis family protein
MEENMSKQEFLNQNRYNSTPKDEEMFHQFLNIINRRKANLILATVFMLIVAVLYNIFSTPMYESSIIAKKEEAADQRYSTELKEMFSMQTKDKLDTEIEIIQSRTVLEKVITELYLNLDIRKITSGKGEDIDIDENISVSGKSFENLTGYESIYPYFYDLKIENYFKGGVYYIQRSVNGGLELYDNQNSKYLESSVISTKAKFEQPGFQFRVNWPNADPGGQVYFKLGTIEESVKDLQGIISIAAIGKTNLAKLTVESHSPQLAQKLANSIIEKYREVRLEQKRQSVLYSFDFVNNQLNDIQQKLEEAELKLSNYKSANQIVMLDESSREIITFLSNLESEKVQVNLELVEYENKFKEMTSALQKQGYFDQTHLTPQRSDGRESPFSTLMQQLSDMEIQRLVLLQKRKENHPDVVSIDQQIDQIKTKLSEYNKNTLTSYQIITNSLKKKRSSLNNLIRQYSDKIEKLPDQESELVKLVRDKNVFEKMFTLLLDKREEFRLAELSKMQDIVIIESAQMPLEPVTPRKALNIVIALFFGIVVGLSIIGIQEMLEKRVITLDDFEKFYPFPLLTIIPKYNNKLLKRINEAEKYDDRLVSLMDDQNIFWESYRVLGLKLNNVSKNGSKSLIITSCEENTGKTSIATNFAVFLANRNRKVLLIDADLRKAAASSFLNDNLTSPGLISYLTGKMDHSNILKQLVVDKKENKTLDYIPAGGTVENSSEILESERMKSLIEELSPQYDHVLIDTPPVTRVIDTLVLGNTVKDIILVIRPNHTFKGSVALGIEEMELANMNILGFIMNASALSELSQKYKYGYGYGYGSSSYKKA